jgi:hypothetical protein
VSQKKSIVIYYAINSCTQLERMVQVLSPAKGTASTSDTKDLLLSVPINCDLTNNLLFAKASPGHAADTSAAEKNGKKENGNNDKK